MRARMCVHVCVCVRSCVCVCVYLLMCIHAATAVVGFVLICKLHLSALEMSGVCACVYTGHT